MVAKVMVVSYNQINEVPVGRFEKGNAIAYSATWDFERFAELSLLTALTGLPFFDEKAVLDQHRSAETALANLQDSLIHDLPSVEVVYIYVGFSAMKPAMAFIKKLQELGKRVHMVACDCDQEAKADFAQQLGIDVIWAGCGGEYRCGQIFAEHAN